MEVNMQLCPKCGSENSDGASFCSLCYQPFGASVPSAGSGDEATAKTSLKHQRIPVPPDTGREDGAYAPMPEFREDKALIRIPGVVGIEGISEGQLRQELKQGGKFVVFQYCCSLLIVTFRRVSPVFFVRAGRSGILNGMRYSLISLLLGWWGFPWGPVFTVGSLFNT
ncbi:MAG: zinc-ribbon domain-containing protein [Actinomycetota bacterium]